MTDIPNVTGKPLNVAIDAIIVALEGDSLSQTLGKRLRELVNEGIVDTQVEERILGPQHTSGAKAAIGSKASTEEKLPVVAQILIKGQREGKLTEFDMGLLESFIKGIISGQVKENYKLQLDNALKMLSSAAGVQTPTVRTFGTTAGTPAGTPEEKPAVKPEVQPQKGGPTR